MDKLEIIRDQLSILLKGTLMGDAVNHLINYLKELEGRIKDLEK